VQGLLEPPLEHGKNLKTAHKTPKNSKPVKILKRKFVKIPTKFVKIPKNLRSSKRVVLTSF